MHSGKHRLTNLEKPGFGDAGAPFVVPAKLFAVFPRPLRGSVSGAAVSRLRRTQFPLDRVKKRQTS
jgi:hypothetical protein